MSNKYNMVQVNLTNDEKLKHIIYMTKCPSGKYYIGRHSTKNVNDMYFGSGKWIRSIKDKTNLTRVIIKECSSFEELLEEEKKIINQHIEDPLNMNFNNSSSGFGTGDLNPSQTSKERERRRNFMLGVKRSPFTTQTRERMSKGQLGRKHDHLTITKRVEKNSQQWVVYSPVGCKFNVKNLRKFCRENNLDQGNMSKVAKTGKKHKGWSCKKITGVYNV